MDYNTKHQALTVMSMQRFSVTAPQQPRNPIIIPLAPKTATKTGRTKLAAVLPWKAFSTRKMPNPMQTILPTYANIDNKRGNTS